MTTLKTVWLSLVLVFLGFACSRNAPRPARQAPDPSKPQFTIATADLATPPVLGTNSAPSGSNATIVLRLQFTTAKRDAFRQFTREHTKQQIQLLVGSNVVAQPFVVAEVFEGRAELAFSSLDEAREVRDWLSKE